MSNKSRYFIGATFLILLGAVFYFLNQVGAVKPTTILTPEVYEQGTTVNLYDEFPRGFPQDLLLGGYEVDYIGEVKNPNGSVDVSVTLFYRESLNNLINRYREMLTGKSLDFRVESDNPEVSVFYVSKSKDLIILTISYLTDRKTMVTIQYKN